MSAVVISLRFLLLAGGEAGAGVFVCEAVVSAAVVSAAVVSSTADSPVAA
jgi:hypothetical protein